MGLKLCSVCRLPGKIGDKRCCLWKLHLSGTPEEKGGREKKIEFQL